MDGASLLASSYTGLSRVGAIRTTEVRVLPFGDVDAAFAFDEGEGDRSLEWWRNAHRDFFTRECATLGLAFAEDTAHIVCERFEVLPRAGSRARAKSRTPSRVERGGRVVP